MRIRRRPQPSLSLQAAASSDLATSTAPQQTPLNAARNRGWLLAAGGGEDEDREAKKLHASSADLALEQQKSGVARRLALLPQDDDNVVAVDCGRTMGGAQHGADDGDGRRMRFGAVNGHGGSEHKDGGATCTGGGYEQVAVVVKAEERVTSNGFFVHPVASSAPPVVASVVKDEGKKQQATGTSNGTGASKKRRGPAVLLEGSRCSRVNGRGWRCSQPTLVGYSLCEHHLGKGRMRSAAGAAAAAAARGGVGAGVGRLGRTEHGARIATAAAAVGAAGVVTAAPAPKAEGPAEPAGLLG